MFWEEGRFSPAGFLHVPCASGYFGTSDVLPRLKRFAPGLTDAELGSLQGEILMRPQEAIDAWQKVLGLD